MRWRPVRSAVAQALLLAWRVLLVSGYAMVLLPYALAVLAVWLTDEDREGTTP